MRTLHHLLGTSALALAGLAAQASEFTPLLTVSQATWPGRNHIGVVCDYAASKDQVESLRQAAGAGSVITVVDARRESQLPGARAALIDRKADYLVLLPKAGLYSEGSFSSTRLVRSLAMAGMPSIGTTPKAIDQGAVFAVGERTGWKLQVSDRLVGTISVELPQRGQVFKGGGVGESATLNIVDLKD